MAYQYGMTPSEFWNCHYAEAKLYVENRIKHEDLTIKNQIILLDNVTDKLIVAGVTSKKPKTISLVKDIYSDLFEKELLKKEQNVPHEGQELIDYMLELSEELRQANKKE